MEKSDKIRYDSDFNMAATESGSGSKGENTVKDSPSQKDLTLDMLRQEKVSSQERQRLEAIGEA